MQIEFDNTYAELPDRFFARVHPEPAPAPATIRVNAPLARRLGFDVDWLGSAQGAEFAVGNRILDGSDPIAMVYAGHQFGNWVPRLGDGRALLLGEVVADDGTRFDVQLKGSGRTPFSRGGDGRSPLGPVLREYVVSEAMFALGIPTSRSLVAAATGGRVRRGARLPGGVLVRVARSHVRIGTFEFFASQGDTEAIRALIAHVVERHDPEVDPGDPLGLLGAVADRQASLVAKWMSIGFIHGVMNTDNMLLSGETIDYGPCAFMNEYDPGTVYSSIDRTGRYAFGNQPPIAQWNISQLAGSLLRVLEINEEIVAEAQAIIDHFPDRFRAAYLEEMSKKLGFAEPSEADWPLIEALLELMEQTEADYTLTFRRLYELAADVDSTLDWELPDGFSPWLERWRTRLEDEDDSSEAAERMRMANPAVIPRNHTVEAVIEAAVEHSDYEPFHQLVDALARPYDAPTEADAKDLVRPPRPEERVVATFCGT